MTTKKDCMAIKTYVLKPFPNMYLVKDMTILCVLFDSDIICVSLMTKGDMVSPNVAKDITTLYNIRELEEIGMRIGTTFDIGHNNVMLNVNYKTHDTPSISHDMQSMPMFNATNNFCCMYTHIFLPNWHCVSVLNCLRYMQLRCDMTLRQQQEVIRLSKKEEKETIESLQEAWYSHILVCLLNTF